MDLSINSSMSRRRALKSGAIAGLGVMGGFHRLDALPLTEPSALGETEHFWYRLAPNSPHLHSQRDNKAFGFSDGKIFLSVDNGRTWPQEGEFREAKNITFSSILKNGNVLFGTLTKLFLSTDHLKTHQEITVKDRDGSDYLPHTSTDPAQPGWYFHSLDAAHTFDLKGREMLIWGNYGNVLGGAVPLNIYYSTDQGHTVKIAYSFGRSRRYTDGGTLLGDPDNPISCRHIHCVTYNPTENAFYACTGDHDGDNPRFECHWLRGTYNAKNDTWDWKVIVSASQVSRYKSGGVNFVDGHLYWAADSNGQLPPGQNHDRGIFRCDPKDIADTTKHTMLFNPEYESANMIIDGDAILSAHYAPASPYQTGIIFSPDLGNTWAQYDLKQFGQRSAVRMHKKNSDGWFRMDLRKGWITPGEVLLIKPK
jgi:hypothetical protein